MGSIDRHTSLIRMIRLDIAITTSGLTWRARIARLYRLNILARLEIWHILDSTTSMARNTRLTRTISHDRLHIHIRG